ncbi:hypothetical protein C0J52_00454 [Blattella germanica]|nr:hypothetical protein C0J52_00454 [Blattella germanica]
MWACVHNRDNARADSVCLVVSRFTICYICTAVCDLEPSMDINLLQGKEFDSGTTTSQPQVV